MAFQTYPSSCIGFSVRKKRRCQIAVTGDYAPHAVKILNCEAILLEARLDIVTNLGLCQIHQDQAPSIVQIWLKQDQLKLSENDEHKGKVDVLEKSKSQPGLELLPVSSVERPTNMPPQLAPSPPTSKQDMANVTAALQSKLEHTMNVSDVHEERARQMEQELDRVEKEIEELRASKSKLRGELKASQDGESRTQRYLDSTLQNFESTLTDLAKALGDNEELCRTSCEIAELTVAWANEHVAGLVEAWRPMSVTNDQLQAVLPGSDRTTQIVGRNKKRA